MPNCLHYTLNHLACNECIEGYLLDANGKCIPCGFIGCKKCNNTECISCTDGYFMDGTVCEKCPSKCVKCEYAIGCLECLDSFLNGGICVENVILHCRRYNGALCAECIEGYYIEGDECYKCIDINAVKCKSSGPITCKYGWIIGIGNMCMLPPLTDTDNCNVYFFLNCLLCTNEYVVTNNGYCALNYVENCENYYFGICNLCKSHYDLNINTCDEVTGYNTSLCLIIGISTNELEICTQCPANNYIINDKCAPSINCILFDEDLQLCLQCGTAFFVNCTEAREPDGCCIQCRDGCKVCENYDYCYYSELGYTVENGVLISKGMIRMQ